VTARPSGLQREATRAPPSFAKSQCGGPPTASIPKTRDQRAEGNSRQPQPCGNSASTGISPIPPIQTTRDLTNHRQHTPHLDTGTTTASAGTKHPVSVRTGHTHPAANHRRAAAQGAVVRPMRWLDPAGGGPVTTSLGGAAAPCRPTAPVAGVRGADDSFTACLLVRDRSGTGSHPPTPGSRRDSSDVRSP
jgi:hypothetical protein